MTLQGLSAGNSMASPLAVAPVRSEEASESGAEKAREAAKASTVATAGLQAWQGSRVNTQA